MNEIGGRETSDDGRYPEADDEDETWEAIRHGYGAPVFWLQRGES